MIIKGLRATSYAKAFFLNGLATALIALVAIEVNNYLNKYKDGMDPFYRGCITFISAFTIAVIIYSILYLVFGFGGGMLASNNTNTGFFDSYTTQIKTVPSTKNKK